MKEVINDQSTANEYAPQRSVVITGHRSYSLRVEPLRLRARLKLRRNRADKKRLKAEVDENRADFAETQGRFIKLEVNDIMISVHLVTEAGDLHELPIQLQDLTHIPQTARINLNFKHSAAGFLRRYPAAAIHLACQRRLPDSVPRCCNCARPKAG